MTHYMAETSKLNVDNANEPQVHSIIDEAGWEEFLLIAHLVYHQDPEAEIADVFEFIRLHILSGQGKWAPGTSLLGNTSGLT